MPRGHCTPTPDESGRILDRLARLEQVIPAEAVRQALHETGRDLHRIGRSAAVGNKDELLRWLSAGRRDLVA